MINFDILKKEYEDKTGIKLFNEDGDIEDFYREINKIHKPVCGRWHVNPIPLTAVKKPFCGIATVDITVLSHPDVWEDTQQAMNDFAALFNGTSKEISDIYGGFYSVSYNCQTCTVAGRILDANVGHGEVFELHQQISYIIIESGVSAYDTFLYIDGIQVPFLSLVESKIHTTSMIPSNNGLVQTMSDQEAYGIDFVVPYMKDESGDLFRDVIDRATGNEAHCVVLDMAGKKSCHIMQFTQASSNVQPPQNVGLNISMTELQPEAAKYNGMWIRETTDKSVVSVFVKDLLEKDHSRGCTIFWGDGSYEDYTKAQSQNVALHIYTDGLPSHTILVFCTPLSYYVTVAEGGDYYGKWLYFLLHENKVEVSEFRESDGEARVFLSNDNNDIGYEALLLFRNTDRIGFTTMGRDVYIDTLGDDGKFYITRGNKFQCLVRNVTYVDPAGNICTSLYDEEAAESAGGYIG